LACEAGAPRLRQVSWSHWPCCCAPEGSPWRITRQSHPNPPVPRTLTSRSAAGRRARRMPAARPRKSQRQCQSRHGLNRRTRARNAASPLPAAAVRREDPVTLSGPPSHLPDHQVVKPSLALETVVSAPEGGERRSAGYRAQPASGPPLGSTEYFFDYLWDKSGFTAQRAQDGLGSMQGGARGFATGMPHGGALTQRAPPLRIPSPFSGFGPVMGGAAFGASSSGDGSAPLLAVLVCCLSAVLWRGRSRAHGAFLRPGTVPRLALERPG
jgi:hypothetical protein